MLQECKMEEILAADKLRDEEKKKARMSQEKKEQEELEQQQKRRRRKRKRQDGNEKDKYRWVASLLMPITSKT